MNTKHSLTALTVFEAAQPYLFWLLVMFSEMNLDEDGRFLDAIPWVSICGLSRPSSWAGYTCGSAAAGNSACLLECDDHQTGAYPLLSLVFAWPWYRLCSPKIPFITLTVWAFCFVFDATLL